MSTLLPEGIDHLGDCPYTLFDAIREGLRLLSYRDDWLPDERPPKRIWFDDEKLKEHFDRIEQNRRAGVQAEPDPDSFDSNEFQLITRG